MRWATAHRYSGEGTMRHDVAEMERAQERDQDEREDVRVTGAGREKDDQAGECFQCAAREGPRYWLDTEKPVCNMVLKLCG